MATELKMESATSSSCYADPNFAIICGFFEKFGKMCGVEFPLASELVMMLECEEGGKCFKGPTLLVYSHSPHFILYVCHFPIDFSAG